MVERSNLLAKIIGEAKMNRSSVDIVREIKKLVQVIICFPIVCLVWEWDLAHCDSLGLTVAHYGSDQPEFGA